jgi:hypothetical protein
VSATASELGSRAVRNTIFILGARIASRVVSLSVVFFMANALGADGYGRYTTLIAFSALVSVVADPGFNPLYTRAQPAGARPLPRDPAGGIVYGVAIYFLRAVDPEEWQLARQGVLARLGSRRA